MRERTTEREREKERERERTTERDRERERGIQREREREREREKERGRQRERERGRERTTFAGQIFPLLRGILYHNIVVRLMQKSFQFSNQSKQELTHYSAGMLMTPMNMHIDIEYGKTIMASYETID